MFRPNHKCLVEKVSGKTDVYGMPQAGIKHAEMCSPIQVRIRSQKSSVRADSSASRGNAMELETDARFLLAINTRVEIDDFVIFTGHKFRVTSKHARYDLQARLDHYEVECTHWSAA